MKEDIGTFSLKVNPVERSDDVMAYLITGELQNGESLDGVTWEAINEDSYTEGQYEKSKKLLRDMEISAGYRVDI